MIPRRCVGGLIASARLRHHGRWTGPRHRGDGSRDARVNIMRRAWLSMAMIGIVIAGCSPTGMTVGPQGSAEPPGPAQPSSSPSSAASRTTPEASPVAVPSELDAACDGTRADIPTPFVRAQADGIHIHVANTSGTALDVQIEDASGATLLGETIPIVGGTFISTFGPGDYRITCGTTGTPFAVVDPDRLFTPSELICADQLAGAVDHAPGATGSPDPCWTSRGRSSGGSSRRTSSSRLAIHGQPAISSSASSGLVGSSRSSSTRTMATAGGCSLELERARARISRPSGRDRRARRRSSAAMPRRVTSTLRTKMRRSTGET